MTPAPAWLLEVLRPGVHGLARLLFGVRFVNPEHVPARGPVVLAPNHVTYLDPVLVSIPIHRPLHYMTLASFFDITGLGAVIRWARAFPVEEDEADPAAIRQAVRVLRRGEPLVIFPEGGRSPDGRLQPFRPGAFRLALAAGAPVVPVTIRGAIDVWPVHRRLPRPGRVTVTYHPPVGEADLSPAAGRAARRTRDAELADLVRARIATAL